MRFAVFSDVHGNKHALLKVLKDIHAQNPDMIMCLGDLVGYGAFPSEVIEIIKDNNISTVMGNYDDAIANQRLVCGCDYPNEKAMEIGTKSIMWTTENINEAGKEFLKSLPTKIVKTVNRHKVLFVHGSPQRLNEYLYEDLPAEYVLQMMQEAGADVLVCGHTHLPYHRIIERHHVINVGSVGKPKHGDPMAMYAIINLDADIKVSFNKVPYDHETAAQAIEEAGLPAEFATILRTGVG